MQDEFRLWRFVLKTRIPLLVVLLIGLTASPVRAAISASIVEQREAFREVYPEAEKGNWQPVVDKLSILSDYILWPDLRAVYYRALLSGARQDDDEIQAFLQEYGKLKPARELRYHYALQLAAQDRMDDYLRIYQNNFADLGIAKLDCLGVLAELRIGPDQDALRRAERLWLVGTSQAKECDPVFDYLKAHGLLGEETIERRYHLAIEARQFGLARYLSKPLDPSFGEEAGRWLAAQNKSEIFIKSHGDRDDSQSHRDQLVFAVEQIAYQDPRLASELWKSIRTKFAFSSQQVTSLNRHIALWSARRHLPDAYQYLRRLPDNAADTEVRRWQTRTSLRAQNWKNVIRGIDAMESDEQSAEQWQYWRAYALLQIGRNDEAESGFLRLAGERSYYGFLAADQMQRNYEFSHADIPVDEMTIENLATKPTFIRARELFYAGLEGRGRSEWDAALTDLTADEQTQAAILAQRWGWHSRAITTAAVTGHLDDLRIRFPTPYRNSFAQFSSAAEVRPSWAYGVARSESLFMRDVRSSAGAIGLMQLMPATGRSTAREIDYPYAGRATLTDPTSNIRLGTYYLRKMYDRFDQNLVLATAAYNAGPQNVEDWLPASGALDARIWIENIPYDETRQYVRRVMETNVIFNWRLNGNVRRLSDELMAITKRQDSGRTTLTD